MEKKIIRQLTTPSQHVPLACVYVKDDVAYVDCSVYNKHCAFATSYLDNGIKLALAEYWRYVDRILHSHVFNSLTEEGK